MSDAFENDERETESMLSRAKAIGAVGRVLTLGLWGNTRAIERATTLHDAVKDDRAAHRDGTLALLELRARIAEWEDIRGVRVARYAFADLLLDGRQTYGPEWDALRLHVLDRDGSRCRHEDGACKGPLQIHHVIWLSQGGTNDMANLLTLCRYHHGLQHPGNPAFMD